MWFDNSLSWDFAKSNDTLNPFDTESIGTTEPSATKLEGRPGGGRRSLKAYLDKNKKKSVTEQKEAELVKTPIEEV